MLPTCRELGIGFVAVLAARPRLPRRALHVAGRARRGRLPPQRPALHRRQPARPTCGSPRRSRRSPPRRASRPAQLAIAWVLAQGDDLVPIPGTKRRTYLEQNAAAVDVELTEDDLARIDAELPADRGRALRRGGDGQRQPLSDPRSARPTTAASAPGFVRARGRPRATAPRRRRSPAARRRRPATSSRSGPASVPSRSIAVTRMRAPHGTLDCVARASARCLRVQPAVRTTPSSTSSATTSARRARATASGRATRPCRPRRGRRPRRAAPRASSSERIPPDAWTGTPTRGDLAHERRADAAAAGAVEVDQVNPPRAGRHPTLGERRRVACALDHLRRSRPGARRTAPSPRTSTAGITSIGRSNHMCSMLTC